MLTPLFGGYFTSAEISLIGVIFVVTGAVGCFLMGIFLDKTKKFLLAVRFLSVALCVLLAAAIFVLPLGVLWMTCVFGFMVGLLSVPILPACYQYAGSHTTKLPPAVVNGLMMSSAQTWAFFGSLIATYILGVGTAYGVIFCVITVAVAVVCSCFMKEKKEDLKKSVLTNEDDSVEIVGGESDEDFEKTSSIIFQ